MEAVFKIKGVIKNYEWGKKGPNSMVAYLQNSSHKDFKIDENASYAELWLGTHESGPASIPHLNMKLLDWLSKNSHALGDQILKKFDSEDGLPFLFKVLSVNKALSIQAHPNKETAADLHDKFPEHYPDNNHKPEMAIALTKFEALCGFRPISEIKSFLTEIDDLRKIIKVEIADSFLQSDTENNLPLIFNAIMTAPEHVFQDHLSKIFENFKQTKYGSELSLSIKDIFLRTYEQYPGDIGCLCFFFLNYVTLKSGEAIFLAANEPHAYLYGDCIECMACSDNVVRAGLTPKFRDVQTLCSILTFSTRSGSENIFPAVNDPDDPFVKIYSPPVEEFSIDSISLPSKTQIYSLKKKQSSSILLVIKGNGVCQFGNGELELNCGTSLFISSDCDVNIKSSDELLMFRAYCKA